MAFEFFFIQTRPPNSFIWNPHILFTGDAVDIFALICSAVEERSRRAFEPDFEVLALGAAVDDFIYIHLFAGCDQLIRLQLGCSQLPFNAQREEVKLTTMAATVHRDLQKRVLKYRRYATLGAARAQLVLGRTSKAMMIEWKVTAASKAVGCS
jgi:hypothetical protein